jgi:hypothetical protein
MGDIYFRAQQSQEKMAEIWKIIAYLMSSLCNLKLATLHSFAAYSSFRTS